MKMYEKPGVTVDAGMAEGVYAASGAEQNVLTIEKVKTTDWSGGSNGSGQIDYSLTLSNSNVVHEVSISFSVPISNAWINSWEGGASVFSNASSLKLCWTSGMN